jgi:hypothetical protein
VRGLVGFGESTYLRVMTLDLSDDETAALTKELHNIVENDRYPFSPRIRTLGEILSKLRPEPAREPLPLLRHYEPPRAGRRRRVRDRRMPEDLAITAGACC